MSFKKAIITSVLLSSAFSVSAFACGDEVIIQKCKVTDPTSTPLNVRVEPMGKITQTVQNGRVVQVLEYAEHNGQTWALIRDAKSHKKLGWVLREFISCSKNI